MLSHSFSTPSKFIVLCLFSALTACAGAPYEPRPSVPIPTALRGSHESIYMGRVFPLDSSAKEPLFVYERRVSESANTQTSTHVTRDPGGAVVFADSARHSKNYELIEYQLLGDQLGQTGTIRVSRGGVDFALHGAEGTRLAHESDSDAIVVGPTLVGSIVRNLPALRKGASIRVRLAVLERLETIGFDLSLLDHDEGRTRVQMKPSSLIIRMAVAPLMFTFDTASGKLLTLEGRVPPKVRDGDKLRNLDARVEYTFLADSYR